MNEVLENLKDVLLEFQDEYCIPASRERQNSEPDEFINGNYITLTYYSDRAMEMRGAIINSINQRRLVSYQLKPIFFHATNSSLKMEFKYQ